MINKLNYKTNIPALTIAVILMIAIFTASNLRWGGSRWKGIFDVDAKGYYSYLPAVFIYHDLNFSFYDSIENKHFKPENIFDYRKKIDNVWVNKYYCGTAFCQSPFFLATYIAGKFTVKKYDGFEKPFAIAISFAALFYLFLGLFYLKKFLTLYGINDMNLALVLFATIFGTNILYYVAVAPGMSHIYSFAFTCMFIYSAKKYFLSLNRKYFLLMAISIGITVLIRPVNILLMLSVPFLAGSIKTMKLGFTTILKNMPISLLSVIVFIIIVSLQLIIYKTATGHFFVYSYSNEGFNFSELNIFNFLFSYKKGLFLYAPILLVAFVSGLFYLWKQRKFELVAFLIFFFVTVYVLSSWWMWWYGGSFGCRVFIEFIPLISILLGIALQECKSKKIKISIVFSIIVLILFTQIQLYQYRHGIIHWEDMNYDRYWNVFMRVDKLI